MFGNNLKIFFRSLLKQKSYAFINIVGLSTAITVSVLIFLYVFTELSYDNFHHSENVYRIANIVSREGKTESDESHAFISSVGPDLKAEIPEVENYTRHTTKRSVYVKVKDENIKINDLIYADSTFFSFFGFEFLSAPEKKILSKPYELLVTETTAQKLFGKKEVVGETVILNGKNYSIKAVMKDLPPNSHLKFEAIASFESLFREENLYFGWKGGNQYVSYVRFAPNTNPAMIKEKLEGFLDRHINRELSNYNIKFSLIFRPFSELHLNYNGYSKTLKQNLVVFSLVSFLIILITAINFVNLSTAKAGRRLKEVGVKKVLGAKKSSLVKQFISESVFICAISGVLTLIFVELSLSSFYTFLGKKLLLENVFDPIFVLLIISFSVILGILSGIYPAFYLLKFNPAGVFQLRFGKSKERFRNILAGFQFFVTVVLISFVIVLGKQIEYLKNKDLGFKKENLTSVEVTGKLNSNEIEILKNEFKNVPGVLNVAVSTEIPVNGLSKEGYVPEEFSSPLMINILNIDNDFLATYDIRLKRGRKLNDHLKTDINKILVNESLVKKFNWKEDPIGKTIARNGINYEIVGVVEDFNFSSLHRKIEPLKIGINRKSSYNAESSYITLKLAGSEIRETIKLLENKWDKLGKGLKFEISFLDELLDQQYKRELQFGTLMNIFSIISIILAALGLFSLSSFTAELRSKEICIKKVLGASLQKLLMNLSTEYLVLAAVSSVIAVPVAYYLIKIWLADFAFVIQINGFEFVTAVFISATIVIISIGSQVIKTALMNPVDSLRNE